jgi:hypothetical protein
MACLGQETCFSYEVLHLSLLLKVFRTAHRPAPVTGARPAPGTDARPGAGHATGPGAGPAPGCSTCHRKQHSYTHLPLLLRDFERDTDPDIEPDPDLDRVPAPVRVPDLDTDLDMDTDPDLDAGQDPDLDQVLVRVLALVLEPDSDPSPDSVNNKGTLIGFCSNLMLSSAATRRHRSSLLNAGRHQYGTAPPPPSGPSCDVQEFSPCSSRHSAVSFSCGFFSEYFL